MHEGDALFHPRAPGVAAGLLQHIRVLVRRNDGSSRRLSGFPARRAPRRHTAELRPAFEGVAAAEVTGADPRLQECRLNGDCSGSAERVEERYRPVPAGAQHQSRGKTLAQRSLAGFAAVAPFMKAAAAGVQRNLRGLVIHMDHDRVIRTAPFHVGALAATVALTVDNRVLYPHGQVLVIREAPRARQGRNRKACRCVDPRLPRYLPG